MDEFDGMTTDIKDCASGIVDRAVEIKIDNENVSIIKDAAVEICEMADYLNKTTQKLRTLLEIKELERANLKLDLELAEGALRIEKKKAKLKQEELYVRKLKVSGIKRQQCNSGNGVKKRKLI